MITKTKCCNFKSSELGGYSFIFVSIRELNNEVKFFFCADVVHVDQGGEFVSGAVLTYSPHETLESALERWEELGPAFVESDEDPSVEEIAKMAIEKTPTNSWWLN